MAVNTSSAASSGPLPDRAAAAAGSKLRERSPRRQVRDERRLKTIQNLKNKGVSEAAAHRLERGLFEKSITLTSQSAASSILQNQQTHMLSRPEYSEYQVQYRRVVQFLRSNTNLLERVNSGAEENSGAGTSTVKQPFAYRFCFLSDAQLESEKQMEKRLKREETVMKEVMAIDPKDDPRWTRAAKGSYKCEKCGNEGGEELPILFLATVGTHRKEDQSDEPVLTMRCTNCDHLWKETDGETFAG